MFKFEFYEGRKRRKLILTEHANAQSRTQTRNFGDGGGDRGVNEEGVPHHGVSKRRIAADMRAR
jgi:hypothetical protein